MILQQTSQTKPCTNRNIWIRKRSQSICKIDPQQQPTTPPLITDKKKKSSDFSTADDSDENICGKHKTPFLII
jgi:hypothetical protein